MTRFRPTVEVLDARALPSAVIAGSDDPTPAPVLPAAAAVQLADQPSKSATGDEANLSLNYTKIKFQDIHFTGKVTMQDFHFVKKIDKASPQ